MALWRQSIAQKASQRKDISRLRKKRECGSDTFLLKADRGEGEQCSCAPQYLRLQFEFYHMGTLHFSVVVLVVNVSKGKKLKKFKGNIFRSAC